jgi:hypothetical protein
VSETNLSSNVLWEVSIFYGINKSDGNEYLRYLNHDMQLVNRLEKKHPAITDTIARALE